MQNKQNKNRYSKTGKNSLKISQKTLQKPLDNYANIWYHVAVDGKHHTTHKRHKQEETIMRTPAEIIRATGRYIAANKENLTDTTRALLAEIRLNVDYAARVIEETPYEVCSADAEYFIESQFRKACERFFVDPNEVYSALFPDD